MGPTIGCYDSTGDDETSRSRVSAWVGSNPNDERVKSTCGGGRNKKEVSFVGATGRISYLSG